MQTLDITAVEQALRTDGFCGQPGAFSREWATELDEDLAVLYQEALRTPDGALGRGPRRYYVEIHPERLRGFREIATNPWLTGVCERVLGPGYQIIEVGFDVPLPGAFDQPWHRDFPAPEATLKGRRLNSLAFNLTCVDTIPAMGAFEIAPGTQWDDLSDCPNAMFPPKELWPRYISRAQPKLPQMGDISARSALTIHRGTANRSNEARPVFVVGVDAPDATNANHHDLQVTQAYLDGLPARVRDHLTCRVTDRLETVIQHHVIEGLLEAAY
jgi:hypothetical protein